MPSPAPLTSALLVMDVLEYTVSMLPDAPAFFRPLKRAVLKARVKGIPVIHVAVRFREGYPEISPRNKGFSIIRQNPAMRLDSEAATRFHPEAAPQPGDFEIVKRRVSAFSGSDLEVVLRSLDVNHLVLTGIATSGVVLSTLREAADKDYALTVLSDCCADRDEEVHRVLMEKVFIRQADVLKAEEWEA